MALDPTSDTYKPLGDDESVKDYADLPDVYIHRLGGNVVFPSVLTLKDTILNTQSASQCTSFSPVVPVTHVIQSVILSCL